MILDTIDMEGFGTVKRRKGVQISTPKDFRKAIRNEILSTDILTPLPVFRSRSRDAGEPERHGRFGRNGFRLRRTFSSENIHEQVQKLTRSFSRPSLPSLLTAKSHPNLPNLLKNKLFNRYVSFMSHL